MQAKRKGGMLNAHIAASAFLTELKLAIDDVTISPELYPLYLAGSRRYLRWFPRSGVGTNYLTLRVAVQPCMRPQSGYQPIPTLERSSLYTSHCGSSRTPKGFKPLAGG